MFPSRKFLFTAAAALVLHGCATPPPIMEAVGGSRSDGTITMAYEYSTLYHITAPAVNAAASRENAIKRCRAWGYNGAEPFGGPGVKKCVAGPAFACEKYRVTMEYQCTGAQLPSHK